MLNKYHTAPIYVSLLLANGITWLCWIPGLFIRTKQGYVIPNFDTYAIFLDTGFINTQHMLLGIAFQLGVYRLLIGALVATWIDGDPVDDNSWRGTAEHIGSGQSR